MTVIQFIAFEFCKWAQRSTVKGCGWDRCRLLAQMFRELAAATNERASAEYHNDGSLDTEPMRCRADKRFTRAKQISEQL